MKRRNQTVLIIAAVVLFVPITAQLGRLIAAPPPGQAPRLNIEQLEPTVFFPRQPAGQPLKQRAILHLANPGAPVSAVATITVGREAPYQEDLGTIVAGESALPISILDINAPSPVTLVVRDKDSSAVLGTHEWTWQPQKKWKLFSVVGGGEKGVQYGG